jgi:hypothetical protein
LAPAEASRGTTSEPHAGQWNVLSGKHRISGWPHSSQACLPRASGRADILRRVSSIAPLTRPPQEAHRAELLPESRSRSTSHRGQTREPDRDAKDEPLISYPFFQSMRFSVTTLPAGAPAGSSKRGLTGPTDAALGPPAPARRGAVCSPPPASPGGIECSKSGGRRGCSWPFLSVGVHLA